MKRFLTAFFVSIIFLFQGINMNAQCIATVAAGNLSASGGFVGQQTILSCNFPGDYATVTVPAGIWRFETSVATDFMTISTLSNTVIDTGTSSVLIGLLAPQTVRMHIFSNDACSTAPPGCRISYVTEEAIPTPIVSANDTFICDGFGPVTLTVSNPFGDQTYWYTGSCGSTPIDSGASIVVPITSTTTYYAANYYNNSLSPCGSLVVNIVSNPIVSFTSVQDVLCFGDSTGSIAASSSAGTAPFTYSWSNGMTGAIIGTIDTGNYTVTVSDIYGCIGQSSTTINEPTALAASTSILAIPACAGQATGSIEVVPSGGFGSYTYSWSNNDTSAIADSLDA